MKIFDMCVEIETHGKRNFKALKPAFILIFNIIFDFDTNFNMVCFIVNGFFFH